MNGLIDIISLIGCIPEWLSYIEHQPEQIVYLVLLPSFY